ncbi:Splicing Factor 3B Subunit 2 [Manis pentadactyla]|nr:Splicing Factor 3B Subunit 2 [Manis pentadactyla]
MIKPSRLGYVLSCSRAAEIQKTLSRGRPAVGWQSRVLSEALEMNRFTTIHKDHEHIRRNQFRSSEAPG